MASVGAPVPFRIDIPASDIDDLRNRLRLVRWPNAQTVDDWSQGMPLAYGQELHDYWLREYDWYRLQGRLNGYPQFLMEVDGLPIHFLHIRSKHEDAFPVIMTHGWPGSVVEFLDVIDPLTDPTSHGGDAADAFHLVLPSLPGFGFSGKPTTTGWNHKRIATAWSALMVGLGYDRFGAQGGDWGGVVTSYMGQLEDPHLAGIHLNTAFADPRALQELGSLTDTERRYLAVMENFHEYEHGYARVQSTRPETVGFGLADSPMLQAAWVIEKLRAWSDCGGEVESVFTKDQLLDNVMMFWVPNAGASSARIYWESQKLLFSEYAPVTAPFAYSNFKDLFRLTERWARTRFTDMRYYSVIERGGHFPAFEQPALFAQEVRAGFRTIR